MSGRDSSFSHAASRRPMAVWRVIRGAGEGGDDLEPVDGPANMAIDHALLESVTAGGPPALRLYRWDPPTLSFGRNQPARGLYDDAAARARGIDFVRRPTGGQAVLHDDELTYAVVAPIGVLGRPRTAYRRINEALVRGLRELGLAASLAPPLRRHGRIRGGGEADGLSELTVGRAPAPPVDWTAACFRAPAEGEIVAGGRKLVGSAQRTEARVILQHGSILVGGSQAAAEELLVDGPSASSSSSEGAGWTTLEAELGRRPDIDRLSTAVVTGFERALGISLAPHRLTLNESEDARRLRVRYASREWTWRR